MWGSLHSQKFQSNQVCRGIKFENKLVYMSWSIGPYADMPRDTTLQQYPWSRRKPSLSWQPAIVILTDIAVDIGTTKVTALDELEHDLRRRKCQRFSARKSTPMRSPAEVTFLGRDLLVD